MQLILLSAGRGSRLPKKYRSKPKCLAVVNNKTILENNLNFYNKFKDKIIVGGYKKNLLNKFAKEYKFKIIHNKKYKTTNMVYSAFLPSKIIKKDVVICYGDIVFDKNIYNLLKKSRNIVPIYKDWLKLWKKRMPKNKIKNDAEDLKIKNNILLSIGEPIKKIYPRYQYMGIIKIKKRSYFRLKKYFEHIKNKKIDMTSFINQSISNKKIKFNVKKNNLNWVEIDNLKDLKVANQETKKW
tara:strand:- start:263 stop:982 length:720 start_codon:yes stop_codon:yes gene_type:complete